MGNPSVLETHDASNLAKKTKKSEKKRRRLHPIRRIAKFILGDGEKHQRKQNDARRLGDQLEEGKTCHGASTWHNLLPFLEPLFALDPKLSFIEDRILGRNPTISHTDDYAPISTTPPKSLTQLQAHVQEADLPCTCDECAPKLYKISTLASHGALRDRRNKHTSKTQHRKTPSFSSEKVPKPTSPAPSLTLRFHGTYESMSLVRHHISWLDATYLHPSARPTPSVLHLRSLLSYWYPHLTSHDLRSTLSARQVTTLFAHLNRVFFAGNVPTHNDLLSAGFSYLDSRQRDCFGKSFYNPVAVGYTDTDAASADEVKARYTFA
ncbi:hypothetical protein J4E86_004838 [Alternaria arbusti]|uniref:uncharacterized protein n=1 Tax=Alternaria arbusti TaxID=232088 RepID=UPI0022204807|nr:uncharacterized protein J4E86_004838 [Alternaria arbusti]KAI4957699.1 hypothetical protein J4E86_004838 [Alternaria arbusti]